ncbi:DUF6994 family protein [Arthrobacter zhaoguopingii]|uniref:DUF6994 family protein n=1 Tax=Arthrobacter zhaoguopingii TaxID=2681491 RepID=UPI00135B25E7|nr:hypothetical protein [Arthrobacter zhaoguopingii]
MCVFDTSYDYKSDNQGQSGFDADRDSDQLKADHELLWTKELPSGVLFEPKAPTESVKRRNNYLLFDGGSLGRHVYGSDAITNSYTDWTTPYALADAIASLDEEQKSRYLNQPYTIGSAMIWPVQTKEQREAQGRVQTMNQARKSSVFDRMDLTLECIRRYYAGDPRHPLNKITEAYGEFFELFEDFRNFVDFFHFQDLVTPDYKVRYFLPLDPFKCAGTPASREEYIEYRENVLAFIEGRNRRMADWVRKHHCDVEDDG